MDETLRQLGGLLLGAVPTVILLAVLYALYAVIVHKPLRRVLDERRSKTEGAIEKSRADVAAAEARTAEYEQRLRAARAAVFRAQEVRRKAALEARTAAMNEARRKAQMQVQGRKLKLRTSAKQRKMHYRDKRRPWRRRLCGVCLSRSVRGVDV